MIPATAQQRQVLRHPDRRRLELIRLRVVGATADLARWCRHDEDIMHENQLYRHDNPLRVASVEQSETSFNRGTGSLEIYDPNLVWYANLGGGGGFQVNIWAWEMFTAVLNGALVSTPAFGGEKLFSEGVHKMPPVSSGDPIITVLRFHNLLAKEGSHNGKTTTKASQREIDATDTSMDLTTETRFLDWGQS